MSAELVAAVIVGVGGGRLVGDGGMLYAEGPFPGDLQLEEVPSLQIPFWMCPFEKYPSVDPP